MRNRVAKTTVATTVKTMSRPRIHTAFKRIVLACTAAASIAMVAPVAQVSAEPSTNPDDYTTIVDGSTQTDYDNYVDGTSQIADANTPGVDTFFDASATLAAQQLDGANDAAVDQVRDYYEGNELDLLPAYRWHTDASLYSRCERDANFIVKPLAEGLCAGQTDLNNVVMGVSTFAWSLSLNTFRYALQSSDFLINGADRIFNPVFGALYETGVNAGFLFIAALLIIFAALRAAAKGGSRNPAVKVLLVGFLPLVLLQVAGNSVAKEQESGERVTGSPMWISSLATGLIQDVNGSISSALMSRLASENTGDINSEANCAAYTSSLEALYATSPGTESQLIPISKFWEASFMPAFLDAQYGTETDYSRQQIVCHQLEAQNQTPREIQAAIGIISGYPGTPVLDAGALNDTTLNNDFCEGDWFDTLANTSHTSPAVGVTDYQDEFGIDCSARDDNAWFFNNNGRRDPYMSGTSADNTFHTMLMWDACVWSGGSWSVQDSYNSDILGDYRVMPEDCALWWATGLPARFTDNADEMKYADGVTLDKHGFDWDTPPGAGVSEPANLGDADAGQTSIEEIRNLSDSLRGAAFSTAFIAALLSVVTALIYLFVFLGLSLTVFLSGIAASIMWAALPVTLIMLALDATKKGQGQAGTGLGMKMLKITAGYTFFSAVATLFLTVALVMTTLIGNVLQGVFTDSGPIAVLIQGLSPAIVFFALRKITKKLGIGSMMTPGGAIATGALGGLAVADPGVAREKGFAAKANALGSKISGKQREGEAGGYRAMKKVADNVDKATLGKLAAGRKAATEAARNSRVGAAVSTTYFGLTDGARKATSLKEIAQRASERNPESRVARAAVAADRSLANRRKRKPISPREANTLESRNRRLDARIESKRQQLAELDPANPADDEKREELESQISSLVTMRTHSGYSRALEMARTDALGELLIDADGNVIMSATAAGVELTDAELAAHIEQFGFTSQNGVKLEKQALDKLSIPAEVSLDMAVTEATRLGLDRKDILVTQSGMSIVNPMSGAGVAVKVPVEFARTHCPIPVLSNEAKAVLANQPADIQAETMMRVMMSLGAHDLQSGRSGSVVEILSGGKMKVDSPEYTKGLRDLAAGEETAEAKMVLNYSPSVADVERGLSEALKYHTPARSIVAEQVIETLELAEHLRTAPGFKTAAKNSKDASFAMSRIDRKVTQGILRPGTPEHDAAVVEITSSIDDAITDMVPHIEAMAAAAVASAATAMRPEELPAAIEAEVNRIEAQLQALRAAAADVTAAGGTSASVKAADAALRTLMEEMNEAATFDASKIKENVGKKSARDYLGRI